MHSADHKKIEDLGLVQVIILALILCEIVALEYGWLEMVKRYKDMVSGDFFF